MRKNKDNITAYEEFALNKKQSILEDEKRICWNRVNDILTWEKKCLLYWPCISDIESCFWCSKEWIDYIKHTENNKENKENEIFFKETIKIKNKQENIYFLIDKSHIWENNWSIVLKIWENIYNFFIEYNFVADFKKSSSNSSDNKVIIMNIKNKINWLSKSELKEIEYFIYINIINSKKYNKFL